MKLFKPQVRTRNHTAAPLRTTLGEFAMRCIIRLGSRISIADAYPRKPQNRPVLEINTAEACHNSGDKILMKQCFDSAGVKTAPWKQMDDLAAFILSKGGLESNFDYGEFGISFPSIIKHKNSCKGDGIYLISSAEELTQFVSEHRDTRNYIIEEYKNFTKEYRLHVTKDGCFYTCRKMLKADAEDRWHRHDTNSVWIMEGNPLFERPKNWDDVVAECVKALNAVGLTIGAVDLKIQSEKGKRADFIPDFIVLEINSAASFGDVTLVKYREKLQQLIQEKIDNYDPD